MIIITHFRFQTDKLRQISNDEFYKLFNNKQIVTQDQNQQFPSEILFPESIQSPNGQNSFLLRAGEPQIFLFDEEVKTIPEEDRNGRQGGFRRVGNINFEEFDAELNEVDSNKDALKTVTDSPTRKSPEFSTIKLDISSVAFVLDRKSGRRKQLQEPERPEDTTTTTASPENTEETTNSIFRTTRDSEEETGDRFGEVVDVTITIETKDERRDAVTKSPKFDSGERVEDEVDNVLNVEILKLDSDGETTKSDKKSATTTTSTTTTFITTISNTTKTTTTTTKRTTTQSTTRETTEAEKKTLISKKLNQRGFKRIGFNRGSVESKPRDSSSRPRISPRRPLARTSSGFKNRKSEEEGNPAEPSIAARPVIALLSQWIVEFIKKDPSLKSSLGCEDLVGQALTKMIEVNSEDLEKSLSSAESLAKSLANLIQKKDFKTEEDRTKAIKKAKDSVHGNDVFRRSRVQNRCKRI